MMGMRKKAWSDLFQRYARVFALSWARRKEMDPPERQSHEQQFLPAALALQETPVHPAPRIIIGLILLFAIIALLWAVFGRIDIVATARGKIIPDERTKTIQAAETAIVKRINVRDGQEVKAGQVLLELDATQSGADVARIQSDELSALLNAARAKTMLMAMDAEADRPELIPEQAVDPQRLHEEQRLLEGHYRQFKAQLDQLDAQIYRRQQEMRVIEAEIAKIELTLPIVRERAADYKKLVNQGSVSKHAYLEYEEKRIEQSRELISQKAQLSQAKAAIVEAERQRDAYREQTRRETLDELHDAEVKATGLHQELVKVRQRDKQMRLRSPVDGTIQQLAVHTIGGVVTPAQPLMVVVPHDNKMEVEAFLPNKDIGFVHPDQKAQVKVDTFPFTKYGTINADVEHVSDDAIQDEHLGLVYVMRVQLDRQTIPVNGHEVKLSPGMEVSVEVKTGKRRVIEYFLSPLLQYSDESLRER